MEGVKYLKRLAETLLSSGNQNEFEQVSTGDYDGTEYAYDILPNIIDDIVIFSFDLDDQKFFVSPKFKGWVADGGYSVTFVDVEDVSELETLVNEIREYQAHKRVPEEEQIQRK